MNISVFVWLLPTMVGVLLLYGVARHTHAWQSRRWISEVLIGLFAVAGLFLATSPWPLYILLWLGAIQLWLVIGAFRLRFGRLQEQLLRYSTRYLSVAAGCGIVLGLVGSFVPSLLLQWAWAGLALLTGLVFLVQAFWTLRHFAPHSRHRIALKALPTVTLAIPARNETHALTDCLSAAVASDYPKLEIIVLDDCSQDSTSALIRSFAHDGVRFVQGSQPADGWLGKNQATQTLLNQATGDYILFADVDTHLKPESISRLIEYVLTKNIHMVSILPQQRQFGLPAIVWQLRYFWQIVLPITKRRVPIASQAWFIKTDVLRRLGGFKAVRNKIVPEGGFAKQLAAKDGYRFVVADEFLGFTTAKRFASQAESAIRFLYPTCKRQPAVVFLAISFLIGLLCLPFIAWSAQHVLLVVVCLVAMLSILVSYILVAARVLPYFWPISLLFFPVALAQEALLLFSSMLLYEFGEVNWKGRNVCYPVISPPLTNEKAPRVSS